MSTQESIEKYRAQIQDKVAIVTGAASGLGKQLSKQLANLGAKVLLVDMSENVENVSNEINAKYDQHTSTWIVCNLINPPSIQIYFDRAISTFGHVDIVVNNAGIANSRSLFSQPDSQELDEILAINLRAPMEATRIAVRYFKAMGRPGVILNTASIGGLMPISLMESYGTTKAALIFFTTTCKGLAPLVRVNAVAPYFADTPLVENNRLVNSFPLVKQIGLMKPDKVVRVMLKAICDETLAGDTLMVAMGTHAQRVDFYQGLTLQVTSFIAGGTVNKYAVAASSFFMNTLNSIIGYLRRPLPHSKEY
ncbi:hypothetical protein BX070DRAFT_263255 [Coemansia spiralis]|uniref:NAD(P)-binding protein n=1 Tax=Coemansia umbellata TaxID=1424467 RepID=A0ABQ8PG76_9FUNG|nr:hypothetical protein BX070DRAFT_263255 [Coemansia spiralis]KAJ1988601.1 hypothetical protein EDC05_005206 [Coemansia umbellata]